MSDADDVILERTDVVRDDGVHVCRRMCPTCIFRPGNLMGLRPGRVADMITVAGEWGCIPCHDTLDSGHQAICRGFYDEHRNQALQIATRLGYVRFDDVASDATLDE